MKQDSCISSLEGLKTWFEMNQTGKESQPFFTVWRGTECKGDRLIYRNTEISDPATAWDTLEEVIQMHSEFGGTFRVFITTKPLYNNGMTTILKMPNQNPGAIAQNGIGSMGGYGIYGSLREMVQAEVDRERKMWELERRLEDMQAAQEAKVGEMDNLLQEFLPIVKDLGHKFGMKMMGYGPQPAPTPMPDMAGYNNTDTPAEGYDYERIEPALDNLRRVFPDTESAIEKMSRWAAENPEMAKNLLQNI